MRSVVVNNKILIIMLIITVYASPIYPADIQIGQIKDENGKLMINFSIASFQRNDIIEAIKRGITVKITYNIEIVRTSTFDMFFTDVIIEKKIKRSVKYDYWNRCFLVNEGNKKILYHSEEAMLNYIFNVNNFEIADSMAMKGKDYYIRFKAVLKSIELYFPMNYIFRYIVGIWDFDTGWVNGPKIP
jgi:hypothetical protein